MKKVLAALLTTAVLCVGMFTSASAQVLGVPRTVIKMAKWGTWGPNGIVDGSVKDTTGALNGADGTDTTAAIYVGDMDLSSGGLVTGPGATTAMNGIKVFITASGTADDVDSLYYRIEQSVDGVHWTQPSAANTQNALIGTLAGFDQGNAAAGTTVNSQLSFFIKLDQDAVDGASGTAAVLNADWGWAPYIRIVLKTDDTSTNVFNAARLFVCYTGWREQTQ